MDEEGYLYVMSRVDDVINVAGHRISAGAIEEVLMNTDLLYQVMSMSRDALMKYCFRHLETVDAFVYEKS